MVLRGWVIRKNTVWGKWERWGRQQGAAGCEEEAAEPSHRAHPGVPPLLSKAPGAYRGPQSLPAILVSDLHGRPPMSAPRPRRLSGCAAPLPRGSAAWPAVVASALRSVGASDKALTAGQGSHFLGLSLI